MWAEFIAFYVPLSLFVERVLALIAGYFVYLDADKRAELTYNLNPVWGGLLADSPLRPGASGRVGRVTVKQTPSPVLSAWIRPSWPSAISRAMNRPRPRWWSSCSLRTETSESNSCVRMVSGKGGPGFVTERSTSSSRHASSICQVDR